MEIDAVTPFPGAIVIPALAESASLPTLLASLVADSSLAATGLAVILVVNNRLDASPAEKDDNCRSLRYLQARRGELPFVLGIIDAASPGLELPLRDGGVGLARKLGHDLLLPYLDCTETDPLLISLDADTLVRPGYAGAIVKHFSAAVAGGAVIPFAHQPASGEPENRAIERYELFLRCYVAGLCFAGSPYAFHTVGSAMACRVSAYLKCGGMNRRRAGEDFYFLQSLAKASGVAPVKGTIVMPSPRRSDRVPFGTGRAMGLLLDHEPGAITFYRPDCYLLLQAWLQRVTLACRTRDEALSAHGAALSTHLGSFLEEQGFTTTWQRFLAQHAPADKLFAAFHGWFDAFRTMKLFHYLADKEFPRAEPEEIVGTFPAVWGEASLSMSDRLEFLRKVQNY